MPARGRPFAVKHGVSKMRAYNSWKKMMQRCYNPASKDYQRYGGRGIEVCEAWHNPRQFVDDMGEREKGFSLERVDVDGNYEPINCKWIPMSEQSKNRAPWKHSEEGLKSLAIQRSVSPESNAKRSASMKAYRAGLM